jgi:carbon starvation protein
MATVNLPVLGQEVGEALEGRTGGAVSLAVGMAQIFSGIPGLRGLMSYWYHFAIMFEAMFILTTIDAGTRVARFLVQESLGKFYKPFENAGSPWAAGAASLLVVCSWAYFIHTGTISTLWPMFGVANQLLASVALAVATTLLINLGRAKYVWVTVIPLVFVAVTTATAGVQSILYNFLPRGDAQGYVNSVVTGLMIVCLAVVLVCSVRRWVQALWPSKEGAPLDPQEA